MSPRISPKTIRIRWLFMGRVFDLDLPRGVERLVLYRFYAFMSPKMNGTAMIRDCGLVGHRVPRDQRCRRCSIKLYVGCMSRCMDATRLQMSSGSNTSRISEIICTGWMAFFCKGRTPTNIPLHGPWRVSPRRQALIEAQNMALAELSTPLIPITDEIVVSRFKPSEK